MGLRQRIRPWMLVSAAWVAPAVLGAVNELAQRRLWGGSASLAAILFASLDWLLYALLTPAVFALARRWPLARPHLVRNSLLHLAVSLLFCAAWAGAGTLLKALLMPELLAGDPAVHFASWLFITLPFGVAVYLAVVGIEHAVRFFVEARDRAVQMARLSEQLAGARFAALQAQLNPHFLFNTLNTIAVLVRDGDRTGAARMVEQLSDVLRRTLRRDRGNQVTLDEELELVRQYLAIEQARFSDRLRAEYEVDPALLSGAVPSFALQHLVDNAVRHGIARAPDGGTVRVAARRDGDTLVLTVTDDGAGIDPTPPPAGRGIESTRERLRALHGGAASLTVEARPGGGTIATLRVPYRETVMESEIDRG